MAEQVQVPLQAQGRLRELGAQWRQADLLLKTYIQALNDALGLEGEWRLDAGRMVIERVESKTQDVEPVQA